MKKTEKTVSKQETLTPEIYVQYRDSEAAMDEVVEKVKAQYAIDSEGNANIKSMRVYIKPEDLAAYYVINEDESGKVNL